MDKVPPGSGACCLPIVNGITYLTLGARNITVGMMGLNQIFQQLLNLGRLPEETTDSELLGMARKNNYIPNNENIELDYAISLRQAYAGYYNREKIKNEAE